MTDISTRLIRVSQIKRFYSNLLVLKLFHGGGSVLKEFTTINGDGMQNQSQGVSIGVEHA